MRIIGPILIKAVCLAGFSLLTLYLLTPSGKLGARQERWNKANLLQGKRVLDDFQKKWQDLPVDLNEMRGYARSLNSSFSPYDAANQRLDYIRLSNQHYILRSFFSQSANQSEQGIEEHFVTNWQTKEKNLPIYDYVANRLHVFYPSSLLAGSRSGDKQWHSRVFVDSNSGKRRLVLRRMTDNPALRIAHHDHVEEFVWLPSQNEIVFTASASGQYKDGLYLWNIDSNELTELISTFDTKNNSPFASVVDFYLSLSRVSKDGKKLYVFIKPRSGFRELEPTSFFANRHYYEIDLVKKKVRLASTNLPINPKHLSEKYWRDATIANLYLDNWQELPLLFSSWINLSLQGEWFDVLNKWHEMIDKFSASPLWPYYLWVLCSLYADAAQELDGYLHDEAKVLRSFAIEIARVLATLPEAPTYLRGYGLFVFNTLVEGKNLTYKISRLMVDPSRLSKAKDHHYFKNLRSSP